MLVTFSPHSRSGDAPHFHAGEEFLTLLKGALDFAIGERTYQLRAGDSLTFRSTTPHAWHNPYATAAEGIWVSTSESGGLVCR